MKYIQKKNIDEEGPYLLLNFELIDVKNTFLITKLKINAVETCNKLTL